MREKIVLIGAGSAMFTRGLISDIVQRGWQVDLALVDIDSDALAVAEKLAVKMIEVKDAPVKLTASTDRRDVLSGATVIICTIGVGGRRAWEKDVFIPRKYGIYHPVGDSVMPGGVSRALRMIQAMVNIACDVLELAPEALFFNYGNPMSAICRGVRKARKANMIGLCHGVFQAAGYLASVLDVNAAQLDYTAVGVNHLTWFTEIRVDGKDLRGELIGIATKKLAESPDDCPFSWGLMKLFGAFPAVMDRHVSEFFPQMLSREKTYYGKTLGVDAYSFEDTVAFGDKCYEDMKEAASSAEPLGEDYFEPVSGEHEQVTDIIESIRTDAGRIYSANLPNTGQVVNLPEGAIIESPAVADNGGIRAIDQGPLAAGLVGTIVAKMACVETVVEAALEGSREKFVQALVLDGAVDSLETAEKLADELLAAQADYLPQFRKQR